MLRPTPRAFTLVELLVVVTIILVLLAALVPALSKAVYQAQLVKCATNYKFLGNGSLNYALDYKKRYPYRDLPNPPGGASWPLAVQAHKLTHPIAGEAPYYDLRPILRPYVKINDVFNDPLTIAVDYDDPEANQGTVSIYTSIFYWSGWYFRDATKDYNAMPGFFKIGDRFEAYDEYDPSAPKRKISLSIFAGDIDCAGGSGWSSHPDSRGVYNNRVAITEGGWYESNWTGHPDRGTVDLNYAYEDGSVRRVDKVVFRWWPGNDERMVRINNMNNQAGAPGNQQSNNVPKS